MPSANELLWRSVILQALKDATSEDDNGRSILDRKKAREWFQRGGRDFRDVCGMAGYEPFYIKEKALSLLNTDEHQIVDKLIRPMAQRRHARRRGGNLYTAHGRTMTLTEWSAHLGVQCRTLKVRIANAKARGEPIEAALVAGQLPFGRRQKTGGGSELSPVG